MRRAVARPASDRSFQPGGSAIPAARRLGTSARHRPPPRDRVIRDGGVAVRDRHVARRRPGRCRSFCRRRRFSVSRARLQQPPDRVFPAVAVPGGTTRGARRLTGGVRGRLCALVPGRRAGSGRRRRRVGGPHRLHDATRRARLVAPGHSECVAPFGRARPRRGPRGRRRDSFLRIRNLLRADRGRDERRSARTARRNVGPHRPRPSAVRRAPFPTVRRSWGIPLDARAVSSRPSFRGRRWSGPRGAPPPPGRPVEPLPSGPPPRGRDARWAAPHAMGRRAGSGLAVSRALVRLHAARPRGPLGSRPRRLAPRAVPRVGERPRAEAGADASPSLAQRLVPAILFGGAAVALLVAGRPPADRPASRPGPRS